MSAQIIDGKKIAHELKYDCFLRAVEFEKQYKRRVTLAVVLVGDDPASQIYVRNKSQACDSTNIRSLVYILPKETPEDYLCDLLSTLDSDPTVDGVLVQLPLPKGLDSRKILSLIRPSKDVDGFSADNIGKLMLGEPCLAACTPSGIMRLIASVSPSIDGKHAVVVGRSNIVGKPVAQMLLAKNATVTICHSQTRDLASHTRNADILVAAVGRAELITGEMVKEGAIVIDVGMNRLNDRLCGDVHFESASQKAAFITPVPCGVGPMTIACLIANTVQAAYDSVKK